MTTIRRILLGAFVCVGLVAVSNPVSAAPVFYDESISGEVDLTYTTSSPFLLDLGINRILGTLGCCVDFDSFAFDIPAGLQLAQVDLLFRIVEDPNINTVLITSFEIDDDQNQSGPGLDLESLNFSVVSSPQNNLFTAVLPLGPGGYEMLGGSIPASEAWTLTYEWNLIVEPAAAVPEPGAIALLGIAVPLVRSLNRKRLAAVRRRG